MAHLVYTIALHGFALWGLLALLSSLGLTR